MDKQFREEGGFTERLYGTCKRGAVSGGVSWWNVTRGIFEGE
jgi:hypothetical protein